jgi:hypothetical protein
MCYIVPVVIKWDDTPAVADIDTSTASDIADNKTLTSPTSSSSSSVVSLDDPQCRQKFMTDLLEVFRCWLVI